MEFGQISAVQEAHRRSQHQEHTTQHNNLRGQQQTTPGREQKEEGQRRERQGERGERQGEQEEKGRRGTREIASTNRGDREENSKRDCAGEGEWGRCSE